MWKHQDQNTCQQQQDLGNIRTLNNSISAKNSRDASHRRDTNNGGNTGNRRDVNDSRKLYTAQHECFQAEERPVTAAGNANTRKGHQQRQGHQR
jgi:hypothetical protein